MTEDINKTKYGLKLSIISMLDYEDYREVCDAILKLSYTAKLVDNGNTVFEKVTSKNE